MNSAAAARTSDPHDLVRYASDLPRGQARTIEPRQNGFLAAWRVKRGKWTNEPRLER